MQLVDADGNFIWGQANSGLPAINVCQNNPQATICRDDFVLQQNLNVFESTINVSGTYALVTPLLTSSTNICDVTPQEQFSSEMRVDTGFLAGW